MFKRLSITAATLAALFGTVLSGTVVTTTSAFAYESPDNFSRSVFYHPELPKVQRTYTVQTGDTLSGIAKKFDVNWKKLYCANLKTVGKNPAFIYPGEKIRVEESKRIWCDISPAPLRNSQPVSPQINSVSQAGYGDSLFTGYGGFQSCVIAAESGGNSQVMNATGHYGLYQFSYSTWVGYGGNPSDFGHASVAEQNQVFYNAMATPGGYLNWSPYDGCQP